MFVVGSIRRFSNPQLNWLPKVRWLSEGGRSLSPIGLYKSWRGVGQGREYREREHRGREKRQIRSYHGSHDMLGVVHVKPLVLRHPMVVEYERTEVRRTKGIALFSEHKLC